MKQESPLDKVRELLKSVGSSGLLGPGVQAIANPQLRQNTVAPLAKGVRAGVQISPPVAFTRGLLGKVNPQQNIQNIRDFSRGVGVLTAGPGTQVLGGFLGGAINKATGGSFAEGVNQGVSASQTFGPVTRYVTTPAINRLVPSKVLSNRIGQAGANVLEGVGIDLSMGNGVRPEGIVFDAIAGLASPQFNRPGGVGKGFDVGRNRNTKWTQEDINLLDEVNDFIRMNSRKMNVTDIDNVDIVLSRLARGYLPNAVVEKLSNRYKSDSKGYVKALSRELSKVATKAEESARVIRPQDQFSLDQIKMGFVGDNKGFTKVGDMGSRPPGSALPEVNTSKLKVGGGEYNTKRFNVDPKLDVAIRDVAQRAEPQISANRGGTKSLQQSLDEARQISLEDATKGSSKYAGDALVVAQSGWIKTLTEEIDQLRTTAPKSPELKIKQEQLDNLIINSLGKTSTQAGRTLKAHQYLAQAMSGDAQTQLKRVIAKNPERWPDAKKVADMLNRFDPNDKVGMIKFLQEVEKTTPLSALESIWYNNVLSNTSTHLANLIGNAGRTLWHLSTKPFRVATDVGVSKFTGQPRQEFINEVLPEYNGAVVGLRQGVRKAILAFQSGLRQSDIENLNVPEKALKGRVGSALSVPSRALVAGDELFRSMNETMEIYRSATSTAIKEGLKGEALNARVAELIDNPTPDMLKSARKLGEDLLFQNVSKELRAVGGLRDMFKIDIPKIGTVRPMRFVIPFIQVPLNVAKFGFEASPIGIGATALKGKTIPRTEFNRRMASGVLGTAITVALASLFVEDKLTGRQPKNQKEADAFYAQGKLPYAVRIGDTWVQYNRLPEPFASQLTNLAVLYDEFRDNPDASLSQKAGAYTTGMIRGLADRTFLTGIGDLMNAIEDPERYGKNFLQNIATGFIPASSLTAATARAVDPVVRDPQNLSEAVQAKIPGLSQNVTPRDSSFEPGGVAVRKTPAIQNFLPIKTSKQQDLTAKQVTQLPAKAMLKELKRFEPEQKKAILVYVKKNNPTLFYNVKRELLDRKLNTTKEEVSLRNRSVAERARTIKLELSKLNSREEKVALLKDYKSKGILTDSVISAMKI